MRLTRRIMKIELSKEETQVTIAFLNRVNIQGSEALTLVLLRQKFEKALATPEAPAEPSASSPEKEHRP